MQKKNKITKIIGIDPGTNILGYSVIESLSGNSIRLHNLGVVRLEKYGDPYTKLQRILEKMAFLLDTHKPDEMAIEAPFFGKNVQSMLKLGRAQGVAIAAAMTRGIPVSEYSPKKIKQAITGNGNAAKEQIAAMLKNMLKLDAMPKYYDATDALGVAVCHHLQITSAIARLGGKRYKNWKAFIKDNPGRLKK